MNVTTPSEGEVRRLLAEAVEGLEPAPGAFDAIRTGSATRRHVDRRRRWIVGGTTVLALAAAVAVVLAMVTTTKPKPRTLRVATPSVSPAAALDTYVAGVRNVVVKSPPVDVGGDQIAVLGIENDAEDRHIRVLNFASDAWHQFVDLPLPAPYYDLLANPPIEVGDVTGDGRSDFLVHLDAADAAPGVVVSDHGGTWRLVSMSANPSDVYAARSPVFRDGQLITQHNDCVPDCAGGDTTEDAWSYSAAKGYFEVVDESKAVTAEVAAFYAAYNVLANGPNGGLANGAAFVQARSDVTDNFKTYLNGQFDHDPVTCAQNSSESPWTTEKPAVSGTTATVVAHQAYSGPPVNYANLRVTLKKVGADWKIDAVTCLH